jgi:CubicO group peptidase (beta-lactamase class C family)
MNMARLSYAARFALSSVLSLVAILPAEAQQGGQQTSDVAKPQAAEAVIPSTNYAKVDDIAGGSSPAQSSRCHRARQFIAPGLRQGRPEFNAWIDTMFRIGSVTKQYTAAAIMKLIEQGKISLMIRRKFRRLSHAGSRGHCQATAQSHQRHQKLHLH